MQKGKTLQYAMAGVQAAPGMRMNVQSHVRLPDSEAGYDDEMGRVPYYAAEVSARAARRSLTIPANIGLIFLCALLVAFGVMIVGKVSARVKLAKDISAMESSIVQTTRDNTLLALEVSSARDSARICYAATQTLGMIAASGVEAVPVVAPDTRPPVYTKAYTAAESSPYSVRNGIITGSR